MKLASWGTLPPHSGDFKLTEMGCHPNDGDSFDGPIGLFCAFLYTNKSRTVSSFGIFWPCMYVCIYICVCVCVYVHLYIHRGCIVLEMSALHDVQKLVASNLRS